MTEQTSTNSTTGFFDWSRRKGSSSLRLFCLPTELTEWIRMMAAKHGLGMISIRSSLKHGSVTEVPDEMNVEADAYAIFLFPLFAKPTAELTMSDVKARPWGWVDIRPGELRDVGDARVLTMSTIVAEDFDSEPVHPARFVRWLKRKVTPLCTAGVIGGNTRYGGSARYHDLRYTSGALDLYRDGALWKQYLRDNSSFRPDDG